VYGAILVAMVLLGVGFGLASAQPRPGTPAGFEIDGNLLGGPGSDWFPGAPGTGVIDPSTCAGIPGKNAFLGRDAEWRTNVDTKFKTLSNKNNDNIAADEKPWNYSIIGGNPQKNDITEVFAHSRVDGAGDTWVILAASTRAPQGDNHTDFEFNQAGLRTTGTTDGLIIGNGPHNGRTIGDLLVSVDEVIGGRYPVPTIRRWNGTEFILVPESAWGGWFYAVHNSVSASMPCGAVDRKGDLVYAYEPWQFIELAINTRLLQNPSFGGLCGTRATVMVKTRSSHSFTAELKDFALATLGTPGNPACSITGPSTICAGQPALQCGPEGPGLRYQWSNGDTTRCTTVTAQATYTLTVFGNGCPPTTCTKTVLASTPPTCTITGPDTLCVGQTAQLCGPEGFQGSGFTYLWSTGATSRCITVSQPGTYTLTVSTPNCGSSTCLKTVVAGVELACSISGPSDIDPDSTAILCGPHGSGLTYLWNTGETSRCITIDSPGDYTLTVTSPSCGSSTCTRTVRDRPTSSCRCSFGYPDASNLPRSAQAFHESNMVRAVVPGRDGCPIPDTKLKVWYNDESALSLGIRRVVVYSSPTDSTVTDYNVTPSPATGACVTNPDFGATAQSGPQSGNDTAVDGGRPMWPVLYLTDISFNKDDRSGDWQSGSTVGIPADQVCGVWTTGVRRVFTHLGNHVTVAMDPSPAQNHWDLGAGSDVPPGGFAAYTDEGYGAEISWDLNNLPLVAGHRYRLYTMVHDGDQSAADGGNAGHACTRVVVDQNNLVMATQDGEGGPRTEELTRSTFVGGGPTHFEMAQNYPNPFRSGASTAIRFSVPEVSKVRIGVYTVAGQRVATLVDGTLEPGHRVVEWDGTGSNGRTMAAGMYVFKMEASATKSGEFHQMRKMMMVR